MARAAGDVRGIAVHTNNLGNRALAQNDFERAEERCVRVVVVLRERAEVWGIDGALDVLGSVAASRGEIGRAARIWGGVEGYRDAGGIPWAPDEREIIEPHLEAARTRRDGPAWEEAWREGRAMSLDRTVDYALEGVGDL